MDEFRRIALVLEGVVKEGVTHAYQAVLRSTVKLVAQLLEPHPVVWIA